MSFEFSNDSSLFDRSEATDHLLCIILSTHRERRISMGSVAECVSAVTRSIAVYGEANCVVDDPAGLLRIEVP